MNEFGPRSVLWVLVLYEKNKRGKDHVFGMEWQALET